MKNLNLIIEALNSYYCEKYNGTLEKNTSIESVLKPFNVSYVGKDSNGNIINKNKRYLLFENGEIVRLDTFCKHNNIECNYTNEKVNEVTQNGEHIQRAKYNGKRKEKKDAKRFESSISFFGNIGDSLREAQKANEYKKPLLDENEALKAKIKELESKIAAYEKKAAKKRKAN